MITRHRSEALTHSHKPVCSASIWESPFLHTAVSFCAIINGSVSLKSTNSHLSSPRWVKIGGKKEVSRQSVPSHSRFSFSLRSKCPQGGGDFECVQQEQRSGALGHLGWWQLSHYRHFQKLLFPWEASVKQWSLWPNPRPSLIFGKALSLSLSAVNSTIVSSVWATGKTGWWSLPCDDTKSHAQRLLAATRKDN